MKLLLPLILVTMLLLQGCALGSVENFVRQSLGSNYDAWRVQLDEAVENERAREESMQSSWRTEWYKKYREEKAQVEAYNYLGDGYYEFVFMAGDCITRYRINPERVIDAYKRNCPKSGRADKEWITDKKQTIFWN